MTALEPALARADRRARERDAGATPTPAGRRARTLGDAPGATLAWALDGTTLIVSTALGGIGAIRARRAAPRAGTRASAPSPETSEIRSPR